MSIHWPIIRSLARRPKRIAVVDDRRAYTGIEMLVGATHIASAIEGISGTSTVGIMLPTSGVFPMAALASWMLGRTVVPINYLLERDQMQHIVDDCGTDVLVTVDPMLEFVKTPPTGVSLLRLENVDFKSVPDLRWPRLASANDLGVLLYTSGTSGLPKGVMLSHSNIISNIQQVVREGFYEDDVLLGILPQFHSFGFTVLTMLPLTIGARAVYLSRFSPARVLSLLRDQRPTVMLAIPSMYNAILHSKSAKAEHFESLRYVVSGGEPLPDAVATGFQDRFGVKISEGYGLTETGPASNVCLPHNYRKYSVGPALSGIHERIIDVDSGLELPVGQEGEIRITGPNVMSGYLNLPEETARAFDDKGYFRTGDIGKFDADGHLYITGRLKEMMIVAGENVFPREIEEVLDRHDLVSASGVVGLADDMRGEVPVAFVELVEDAAFDEKDLLKWCREHLAGYKVPRQIREVETLPRNPTGKIMRRKLTELL